MAAVPAVPPSLKQVNHYLKTAIEHDKRDPVISYYCRLYAMQKAMEIDKQSPEARSFLLGLMDYLEQAKSEMKGNEAISNEMVGQAHVENYALKLFLYADNEDRAAKFGKNVVKSFYTAGMLMDVLTNFGELSEDIEKNRKYAKWKAAYIHNCLKSGETPIPGPMADDSGEFGDMTNPSAAGGTTGYPADTPQAPPSGYIPPGQDSTYAPTSGVPPPQHQPPPPQPQSASLPAKPSPARFEVPPGAEGGVKLAPSDYQKAMKFCKYASSALQYEDSPTAIDYLNKCLKLLTTGQE